MKRTITSLAAALAAAGAFAQGIGIAEVVSEGHITGPLEYRIADMQKAPNGDLVFLGDIDDGTVLDLWVVRTSPTGTVLWSRTFPKPGGAGDNFAHRLAIGADGKIYTVSSIDGSTSLRDFYYLCLNGVGIKLNERVVDHFDNDYQVGGLQVAPDGTVYFSAGGLDSSRPLLVKMDANLNTLWSYTLGAAGAGTVQRAGGLDVAPDGSVVCSATYDQGGHNDVQFVRLLANGTFVYEKLLGSATDSDAEPKVLNGTDGMTYFTYTRSQFTVNQEARLSQYDAAGAFQWNKTEPGYGDSQFAEGPDGRFVFATTEDSSPFSTKVFKFDTAGAILWNKTLTRPSLDNSFLDKVEIDSDGYISLQQFAAVQGKVGGDYLVTALSSQGAPLYEWTWDTGPGNYDIPTGLVGVGLGEAVVTGFANGDTHTFRLKPVLPVPPTSTTIRLGRLDSGTLGSLAEDDDDNYRLCKFIVPNVTIPPINVEFEGTVAADYPVRLVEFVTVVKATTPGLQQDTQLWNWLTPGWDTSTLTGLTTSEVKTTVIGLPDPTVEAGTRRVRARLRVRVVGPVTSSAWCVDIDKAAWRVLP